MDGSHRREYHPKTGSMFIGYSETTGDYEGQTETILQTANGEIWIATTQGIFRFDSQRNLFEPPGDKLLESNTRAIESTADGAILVLNETGLILWDDENASILLDEENFPIDPKNVLDIKQFDLNDVWVFGDGGVFRYSLHSNQIDFNYQTSDPQTTVWNLHKVEDGYIINSSEGFYELNGVTNKLAPIGPHFLQESPVLISFSEVPAAKKFCLERTRYLLTGELCLRPKKFRRDLLTTKVHSG